MNSSLDLVFLGLSITSSWGNGHATTYRALIRSLANRGHRVLFLERDVPWYAANRDLPDPPFGRTCLYADLEELQDLYGTAIREADAVIVGSFVPQGVEVGRWVQNQTQGVKAFYDIDTPVTLSKLARGDEEYLSADLMPGYQLYLSFTGGPTLNLLEERYGVPMARPLYCSVDPEHYFPQDVSSDYALGYMGTYSDDRQPTVERLLNEPARACRNERFVVAGPQYPASIVWPENVERIEHLPPSRHCEFYNRQRLTLNVTRADMICAGYAPSVRLFEAAACQVAIISDWWPGLDQFFIPGEEIFIARSPKDVLEVLERSPENLQKVSQRARTKVLAEHTAENRAVELEQYILKARSPRRQTPAGGWQTVRTET